MLEYIPGSKKIGGINTRKIFGITTTALIGFGLIMVLSFCALLMLGGCGKPKVETVTLSISIEGGGTTIPAPGKHSIAKNTVVTLKTNPDIGNVFSHWAGSDGGLVTGSNTLMMDKDRVVTAVFTKLEYDLVITVTPEGAGTVTETLVTDKSYEHGQIVHLTSVPADGFVFDHWAGADAADVTDENNILMDEGKVLEAVFANYLMAIHTQPVGGIAGQVVAGYPTVKVATPGGTPVAGITVTVAEKNGARISGTLTRTTDAAGLAVFNDLILAEGMYTLVFSSAGIADVQSNLFRIGLAGAGSDTDPYRIHNVYGLYLIWENKSAVYRLENDIDASATGIAGTLYWNSGAGWLPIDDFQGTIDGNHHQISNLFINRPTQANVGLIGTIVYWVSPVIKDLHLIDVNITGAGYTGALIGSSMENTIIQNCSVSGAVTGNGAKVGGLLGYLQFATISNCSSSAIVTGTSGVGGLVGYVFQSDVSVCYASGNVVASGDYVGGFIGGVSTSCNVTNCYARGNVSGVESVGGFVGFAFENATFGQCYSAGTVIGNANVGGFVGEFLLTETTTDCYYDRTVCGLSDTTCGTIPKTTAELQDPNTFGGWDPAIWSIVAGQYPTLMP